MYIHEAVKKAMQTDSLISRETTLAQDGEYYAVVKPTNSYNACFLFMCKNKERESGGAMWNPTIEDLIANDWKVLRDKFSNKVSDV